MRHATLLELAERDGILLPDSLVDEWPPQLSAADEKGWFRFQRLYDVARSVLRTEDDVRRLVREAAEDDVRDGGRWLEIQVDPSRVRRPLRRDHGLHRPRPRRGPRDLGRDRARHRRRHRRQPHPTPARRPHPGPARRSVRRPRGGRLRAVQRRAPRSHRGVRTRLRASPSGPDWPSSPTAASCVGPGVGAPLRRVAARRPARPRGPVRGGPRAAGPARRRRTSRWRSAPSPTSRSASTPT